MYISIDEFVAILSENGLDADRLTDMEGILRVLGGQSGRISCARPLRELAAELAKFFDRHKYRLNVRCQGECLTCPPGTLVWCGMQLPKAKEVLNGKEVSEVRSEGH